MIKIVQDDKVIDIVKYPVYVKFIADDKIAISNKDTAQGVVGSDTTSIYSFTPVTAKVTGVAAAVDINEEEFDRLATLLDNGILVSSDEDLLADSKHTRLRHLSDDCNRAIISGFSVKLSDGNMYNFRLTTEDQLNLLLLENQLNSGAKTFIYHATDRPCMVFSKKDMKKIIEAFRRHLLYHTTYFNAAKQYINSLFDVDVIEAFTYGVDISNTVHDTTIQYILRTGGRVL